MFQRGVRLRSIRSWRSGTNDRDETRCGITYLRGRSYIERDVGTLCQSRSNAARQNPNPSSPPVNKGGTRRLTRVPRKCKSFQRDNSALHGGSRGLSTISHVELFEHVADVQFHRHFCDLQGGANFFVAQSLGNHAEDFEFATGQRAAAYARRQYRGDRGIEITLPFHDLTNGA